MSSFAKHSLFAFKVLHKSNKAETSFILIVYTTQVASTDILKQLFIHLKHAHRVLDRRLWRVR